LAGDSRKQKQRPVASIPREVQRDLEKIGRKHRKFCAGDRDAQRRFARFYRARLFDPRKRGAKPKAHIVDAVARLQSLAKDPTSKDWQRIYQCIPGYERLDYAARRHQADNLRHAALARLKREQIRGRKSVR
jgi:hypothetical protein